jgi:LuxR family maltose regulon positive regulatory protein
VQVQFVLAQGDLAAAAKLESLLPENAASHPFYRFLGLAKAQLWLAQGRDGATTREYLERCHETASRAGWQYGVIAARVLQSLAAPNPKARLEFIADALNLAQPEGFIRTFVDAGRPLIPALEDAARQGITPVYVGKILAALGDSRKTGPLTQKSLAEPLSEREIEVLRLVTAGLSNREIAEKLFVSPGTAKTHIHNLCGKLEVRNRTEAAMKAKELGLV